MQCGLFYQLPCAPEQSMQTRYRETVEQIVYVDALGFDSVWPAEHHFTEYGYCASPQISLAAVAARTKRIRARSRSTTRRTAADWTRPAESFGFTFFHRTGETS